MYRLVDNTYIAISELATDIHNKNKSRATIDRPSAIQEDVIQYGIFAATHIKKGDVIMQCIIPLELLTKNTFAMRSYRFAWRSENPDDYYEDDFVLLGNGGLVNNSTPNWPANMGWKMYKKTRVFEAVASKDIAKNEEILSDYSDPAFKPDPIT